MAKAEAYLRDAGAIYAESFRIIRAELAARGGPPPDDLTLRLIHASGMVDLAEDLRVSPGAIAAGRAALACGAPILCDSGMVARGIITRALSKNSEILVTLDRAEVPALARKLGTTRSAAAVALWRGRLEGAIVAIGSAPTALFALLEGLAAGWPRPALILGFPVGFVGAAAAKAALCRSATLVPYATVLGRRGGAAMAAAAVNALTLSDQGDGT